MTSFRRLLAGARIALIIALLWTATIIAFRAGTGLAFSSLSVAEFTEWFGRSVVSVLVSGLILGALFALGVVLTRGSADEPRLTRRNAIGAGALGGLLLAASLIAYYSYSPFSSVLWEIVVPTLAISAFGAATGYGIWRTTHHAEVAAGEPPPDLLKP